MSRHKLTNSAVKCVGAREVTERQILGERGAIQFWMNSLGCKQDLDLRPKQKSVYGGAVIQWLDSEAIAGCEQAFSLCVPNRKRKHSAKMLDAILSVLLVEMDDAFSIAMRAVPVTESDELLAKPQ